MNNIKPELRAGDLFRPVQIQSQSTTPDAFGQPQQTWTTICSTRAAIEALSMRELFQSGQLTSQVTHEITIRYRTSPQFTPGMRVINGPRTYLIQALDTADERNVLITMYCLELNGAE